jgi:hypothetical protein
MDTRMQRGTARKVEGRTVFHFDSIFDEQTQTPLVYMSIARPMVQSVLDGKHTTIFAGQTGSGKTFTIQRDGKKQSGQAGIIQVVASDLFRFTRIGARSKRDNIIPFRIVDKQQPKRQSSKHVEEATAQKAVDRSIIATGKGDTRVVLLQREEASSEEEEIIITVQPHTDPLSMIIFLATMNTLF